MKALRRFTVRAHLPAPLAALERLSVNLRWSWDKPTQDLFAEIDPRLWQQVGDPVALLGQVGPARLEQLAGDELFVQRLDALAADLDDYLTRPLWYQQLADEKGTALPKGIAYYSMEFGGAEVLPNYSGGLGPKQRQGDFKSPEGFYNVSRSQLKPDSRFYKAINIGFPNAYDRAHGYEGKYLMIHGACVSVGCYAMTDTGFDEIFQFVTGALVFGQPSVQVSIYPFRMTDANMARHKFSYYADFWKQLKPGYDYFQQTHKPPVVSVMDGRYIVSKPLSHEVIQPQLASNYTLPEAK